MSVTRSPLLRAYRGSSAGLGKSHFSGIVGREGPSSASGLAEVGMLCRNALLQTDISADSAQNYPHGGSGQFKMVFPGCSLWESPFENVVLSCFFFWWEQTCLRDRVSKNFSWSSHSQDDSGPKPAPAYIRSIFAPAMLRVCCFRGRKSART